MSPAAAIQFNPETPPASLSYETVRLVMIPGDPKTRLCRRRRGASGLPSGIHLATN